MSLAARLVSDPSNLILLMICAGTLLLMLHGETIVKVPRYGFYEVKSKESGKQWLIGSESELERLQKLKQRDPTSDTKREPPCLPQEDPDYEEKKKKRLGMFSENEAEDVVIEGADGKDLSPEKKEGLEEGGGFQSKDYVVIEDEAN